MTGDTVPIELGDDQREVEIDGVTISLHDMDGGKLHVDHVSAADGYIAFSDTFLTISFRGGEDGD